MCLGVSDCSGWGEECQGGLSEQESQKLRPTQLEEAPCGGLEGASRAEALRQGRAWLSGHCGWQVVSKGRVAVARERVKGLGALVRTVNFILSEMGGRVEALPGAHF